MAGSFQHRPVLLAETVDRLALRPGAWVVDGTVGGGGHAVALLEATAPDGRLIGLDVDAEALAAARSRLERFGPRVQLIQASFRQWRGLAAKLGVPRIDAMLLDLGVSSHQLDTESRGFRFGEATAETAPLDMRMDRRHGPTAADLLNRASEKELETIFRSYGELPGARRLAQAVASARRRAPLRTARDLLRVVHEARIGRGRHHHPATLVFQALRIAVNDEIEALREGLDAAIDSLAPGGRLAVIAYHSLEDRLVKRRFVAEARGCVCPPRQPVCTCGRRPRLRIVTRRAVRPGEAEQRANPRARSARLRVAERLGDDG